MLICAFLLQEILKFHKKGEGFHLLDPWTRHSFKHVKCNSKWNILTNSSSSLNLKIAFSLLVTRSSKYWYRNFFLALHSLALCLLRSNLTLTSTLVGRLPGRLLDLLDVLSMVILFSWRKNMYSISKIYIHDERLLECRNSSLENVH